MSDGGAVRAMQRLFVALDLPAAAVAAVEAWQRTQLERRTGLRVSPSLHLTLAFLGDTDRGLVPAIAERLTSISWAPIATRLAPPLFLPAKGSKRVVALGLEDAGGRLAGLRRQVVQALAADGVYAPEKRPWLPHITVARFRLPGQPFDLQNVNIAEFRVVRMVLYSSQLEHAGAVHTPLAVFPAS